MWWNAVSKPFKLGSVSLHSFKRRNNPFCFSLVKLRLMTHWKWFLKMIEGIHSQLRKKYRFPMLILSKLKAFKLPSEKVLSFAEDWEKFLLSKTKWKTEKNYSRKMNRIKMIAFECVCENWLNIILRAKCTLAHRTITTIPVR